MKFTLLWLVILNIHFDYVLGEVECYKCIDKFDGGCYYGNEEYMTRSNCSEEEVCIVHITEITQRSHSYKLTKRGCFTPDFCDNLKTVKKVKTNSKTVHCKTCNTTLCNDSAMRIAPLYFICILLNVIFI
ncbi:unnamed protein product [Phyllotreta striolata]|uniref:Protein sleepless n=1 Tax=Phyllotreta striolata TaxID=444603 RepID=A0A9N9TXF0_PHYSR|nr:unnamed protein product [Phyllotreta striolata]